MTDAHSPTQEPKDWEGAQYMEHVPAVLGSNGSSLKLARDQDQQLQQQQRLSVRPPAGSLGPLGSGSRVGEAGRPLELDSQLSDLDALRPITPPMPIGVTLWQRASLALRNNELGVGGKRGSKAPAAGVGAAGGGGAGGSGGSSYAGGQVAAEVRVWCRPGEQARVWRVQGSGLRGCRGKGLRG